MLRGSIRASPGEQAGQSHLLLRARSRSETSSRQPAMTAQLRAAAAAAPRPRSQEVPAPRTAVPMRRLGPKACPVSCTLLTFLLLATCSIHETEQKGYCENIITQKHLDKLQELIDSQMLMPCRISFEFIDEKQLEDSICFIKAAFPGLADILEKMQFKENSDNFNKTRDVRAMYKKIDENEEPCISEQSEHEHEVSQACFKEFSVPPEEMLQLVKDFFGKVMVHLKKGEDFARDCSTTYQKCSNSPQKEPPSPDQRRREALPRESRWVVMTYVLVASLATVVILLAVGGLLFYRHRVRVLERRLQCRGNAGEEQEGRPLNGVEEHLELQGQGAL
ncbi:macrophage colony-stimulating factor 1 isoform X2 [Pelodiscus sinensis]|uniref:macrophage colony-stimulating factor 1 isoform X2 n=1 Tax=Pelodiscus sinensis TaxID=13735 RepID=UPI000D72202F|nr:macrophage colony-stimulating factor 1 isoform X3 [Pelodiscus sinensis]|eukprot:XP_025045117.1 macrophage colony-stimulating factor 1 isoform X3 [Pelodiscus sinensis]